MRKIFLILLVLILNIVKSQQEYPLETPAYNVPNYGYLKDTKSKLTPFVGRWEAFYNGNIINLVIEKEIKVPFSLVKNKTHYKDQLLVKYEIKDKNGRVLESTLNQNFKIQKESMIAGYKFDNENRLMAIVSPKKCSIGLGFVFLKIIGNNQISWTYNAKTAYIADNIIVECKDVKIFLPEVENLIFTKK